MPLDKSLSLQPDTTDTWKATLSRGDVVWFRFPLAKHAPSDTGPKRRPCLVLEVFTCGQEPFAKIAYGTSVDTKANRGKEIRVQDPDAMAVAGLDRPSRFVCARTLIVSLNHPAFELVSETGSPVIGRLDGRLMARMNTVRARLDAEADMAAAAREERRKEQLRWQREGDGFRKRNRALRAANPSNTNGAPK